MITCKTCGSDVRICPVCEGNLSESVNGDWFHPCRDENEKTCIFGKAYLDDAQLEYLAKTKTGYIPKKFTACQFCKHFVGHKSPTYNQKPCAHGDDETMREVLHTLARMDRCPAYSRAKGEAK